MRLESGSITIEKPLESVYAFISKLENLEKQIPHGDYGDYKIGVDEGISGDFIVGEVISFYMFAVYEGDEDKCFELEVVEVAENKKIEFELVYMAKYDEENDDWSPSTRISDVLGKVRFEMILTPIKGRTKISMFSVFEPKSKAVAILLRVINFIGRFTSKKYYKNWARLIEKYV